jgi:hypothetical protein
MDKLDVSRGSVTPKSTNKLKDVVMLAYMRGLVISPSPSTFSCEASDLSSIKAFTSLVTTMSLADLDTY